MKRISTFLLVVVPVIGLVMIAVAAMWPAQPMPWEQDIDEDLLGRA